jgi:Glycine/sarcosine/betaine reductase selenoprotein B (GRDB).
MDFAEIEKEYVRRKTLPDFDWTRFAVPTEPVPLAKPVEQCRVALVVTAGAYLPATQEPFQIRNPLGDDSYRILPGKTTAEEIALSHPGYDTRRAKQDLDCVFPLNLLQQLAGAGTVGSVAPRHFSFMGYIPRTENLLWRTAPQVGRMLLEDQVDLALLVPS